MSKAFQKIKKIVVKLSFVFQKLNISTALNTFSIYNQEEIMPNYSETLH